MAEWLGRWTQDRLQTIDRGFDPRPNRLLLPRGLRGVVACIWDNDAEMAGYILPVAQ